MMTPQETAQYGQVLRVSVVREIFSSRISARARFRSHPSATAPPTAAAEPFKKVLRFMGASPLVGCCGAGGCLRGDLLVNTGPAKLGTPYSFRENDKENEKEKEQDRASSFG